MIGDYIVGKTLGEGSFGKVKVGIHMRTRQQVALKIIDQERVKSSKDKANLEREIRIMKLLEHEHIVKMFDVIGARFPAANRPIFTAPLFRVREQRAHLLGYGTRRRRRLVRVHPKEDPAVRARGCGALPTDGLGR